MATQVIMPALGMAQETGRLVNWLKKEGDAVVKGELLMEIETDKSVLEFEAPASGILTRVTPASDEDIPVGQTIALIVEPGEKIGERAPLTSPKSTPTKQPVKQAATASAERSTKPESERKLASPAARRLARERGIDLRTLVGTGPGGAVLARDVVPGVGGATETETESVGTVPLTAMRRIIGERMTESKQNAPHFYISMEVDMSRVVKEKAGLSEEDAQAIPTLNDFVLLAVAGALKESPLLNATLTEQGVRVFSDINLGFAVAIDDGLVVPVIRNADRLDLQELAQKSRELADRAQKKRLTPADTQQGTFTVSNLGMFGVDSFVAIINPPQCAILAVGQVAPRVVPHGEGIAVRSMMTLTLSADHRIVDGVIAARFLQLVRQRLENLRPSSQSTALDIR